MPFYKDLPLEEQKRWVKSMLERMASAYGVKKSQLPQQLNISKNVINNWVYNVRIPVDQLLQCSDRTGVSLDWLIKGQKPDPTSFDDKAKTAELIVQKHNRVFDDGIEYGLIQATHDDAIDMLSAKFARDLKKLLGLSVDTDLRTVNGDD